MYAVKEVDGLQSYDLNLNPVGLSVMLSTLAALWKPSRGSAEMEEKEGWEMKGGSKIGMHECTSPRIVW